MGTARECCAATGTGTGTANKNHPEFDDISSPWLIDDRAQRDDSVDLGAIDDLLNELALEPDAVGSGWGGERGGGGGKWKWVELARVYRAVSSARSRSPLVPLFCARGQPTKDSSRSRAHPRIGSISGDIKRAKTKCDGRGRRRGG